MPSAPIAPAIRATIAPPVMEARRWLAETPLPQGWPLLNLSQAAPVDPPPDALREVIAEAARNDASAHLYGPVLGLPALRAAVADDRNARYGSAVTPDQVAITSGCNQAFCAAIATLARAGDEVLLPVPWYFNHAMWLTMNGIRPVPVPCNGAMLPDLDAAAGLITPRTRALVLVSPNNPTGAEYPPDLLARAFDLTRSRGLALIVDETYLDFDSRSGPAHDLFQQDAGRGDFIHLYSFSKAFRLTGHRVGAMVTGTARLAEVEKFLDTVTICPNQLGQRAALWGMGNLADWLAGERQEILNRRAAIEAGMAGLADWRLKSCGAYFAYVEHPFDRPSDEVAKALLASRGLLCLPGTMFGPTRTEGGDGSAERHLRIAFANADAAGIGSLFDRLAGFAV